MQQLGPSEILRVFGVALTFIVVAVKKLSNLNLEGYIEEERERQLDEGDILTKEEE